MVAVEYRGETVVEVNGATQREWVVGPLAAPITDMHRVVAKTGYRSYCTAHGASCPAVALAAATEG